MCLCPFVPIACYNWYSIQIKTLFTAKENYLAVLVLFSLSGMNDDWAMRIGWLIAPGTFKKIRQLTSRLRDERWVNVTMYNPFTTNLCLINDEMLKNNKWQPLLLNLRVACCSFSGLSGKGSLLLSAWGKDLSSSMTCHARIRNASTKFIIDNFVNFWSDLSILLFVLTRCDNYQRENVQDRN